MDENGSGSPPDVASLAGASAVPYDVEHHESIQSTNDRARELASAGAVDLAVIADEQTIGRGRRGRDWSGPRGGIYASIVLSPDVPPATAPVFTLAAAVATVRACEAVGVESAIKWPNDVVVEFDGGDRDGEGGNSEAGDAETRNGEAGTGLEDAKRRGGRKLAGILTETESEGNRLSWLVVGIGLNANVERESLPPGATSLRLERGEDVDRVRVVRELLGRFHELASDRDAVLPAWRERASTLGRRVRVETPGGTIEGRAVDVVDPGALVVETPTGRRTVYAGECTHLRRSDAEENRYED